ncbi:hypothetical protein LZ31DRAFT_387708 [Colletotrichum somersetense]|nr:hypothetical protein LZ31DRAFT_387708 [Colletotrichum somersetense]
MALLGGFYFYFILTGFPGAQVFRFLLAVFFNHLRSYISEFPMYVGVKLISGRWWPPTRVLHARSRTFPPPERESQQHGTPSRPERLQGEERGALRRYVAFEVLSLKGTRIQIHAE